MLYQTLFVLASVISLSNNVEAYPVGRALLNDDLIESLDASTSSPESPDGTGSSDSVDLPSTTGSSSDSDSASSDSDSTASGSDDNSASGSDDNSANSDESVSRSVSDDSNNNSIDDDVEQFEVDSSGQVINGSPDSNDDLDEDGKTNSQDSDDDGDGIPDSQDTDDDDDGVPDSQDKDDDNDGVNDSEEYRRAGVIDGDYDTGYLAAEKAAKATTSELYTVIGVLGGIIGALLIVVGGAAYYFYQKNMKENEDVNRAVEMVDVEANAMPQTFRPNSGEFRAEDPMIISQD